MSNMPAGPPGGPPHHHYPRRHAPQEYQHYPPQQYYPYYAQQIPPPYPYNPQFVPPYPQQWYGHPQQYMNAYQSLPQQPQRHYGQQQHPHSSPLVVSSLPYRPPPSVRAPSFHSQHPSQARSPQPPEQPPHHHHQQQQQQPQPQQHLQHPLPPHPHQPPEPSHTPSTHSQAVDSSSTTPVTRPADVATPPIVIPPEVIASANANETSQSRKPYLISLPWTSVPESEFPAKAPRRKRKKRAVQAAAFEYPARDGESRTNADVEAEPEPPAQEPAVLTQPTLAPDVAETEISATSYEASETGALSTQPTTPASSGPVPSLTSAVKAVPNGPKNSSRPVIPAVPIIPKPVAVPTPKVAPEDEGSRPQEAQVGDNNQDDGVKTPTDSKTSSPPPPPPVKPTSWAALLRSKGGAASAAGTSGAVAPTNNDAVNGIVGPKVNSLADALRVFNVNDISRFPFIEPRGLINTGNMCYMNSILQTLMFCIPFYEFLDQIGRRHVHSFKSDTPLLEAMIMFMREFNVIDAATEVEKLRMRLKDSELEQYGEAFIPEYVYDVIKRLPRFSTMRRGHQQDAEEFLGFLLEGLHDECVQVIKNSSATPISASASDIATTPASEFAPEVTSPSDGWLEVGPKQRAAVTRSSGSISTESPVTKIFGGKRRSELRVPGLKNSVTHEPFQALQLDIGDPSISNITDALKGMTRSETLHGEFNSPRGPNTAATRQFFIETLPPVLILHLKRFQYDNASGTQKIWKKIGYPLELEIPKDVFPQQIRSKYSLSTTGLPKYRLIGVVYHHGKSAAGGHYTVDVRRQEGREWIRFDDTIVRRVRSDDVANEGGEEDPKVLAAALEQHKRDQSAGRNIYDQAGFGQDDEADNNTDDQAGWSQVNGGSTSPSTSAKKWSSLGKENDPTSPSTGKQTPKGGASKQSVKDNKVAYILFYQKISA